jgi:hypothetical protein
MSDVIVSPSGHVSLLVLLKDGIWEDTGVRLYQRRHLEVAYRLVEEKMLGTLSKKHYYFGMPTGRPCWDGQKVSPKTEMRVVCAYERDDSSPFLAQFWVRKFLGLGWVGDGAVVELDRGDPLDQVRLACTSSRRLVTGVFEPVEE